MQTKVRNTFLFGLDWGPTLPSARTVAILRKREPDLLVDASSYTMRWNWADHAFTNMFRIENWPDTMTADKQYPGKNFSQNGFTRTQLRQDILPAMEKALGNPEYANDDKVSDKWLRVVGWTEGTWWTPLTRPLLNSCLEEQELSPDEQGDIPLVVTVTGKVLLKLLDSAKFIKQTKPKQKAKRGAATTRRRRAAAAESDAEGPTIANPAPSAPLQQRRSEQAPRPEPPRAGNAPPWPPQPQRDTPRTESSPPRRQRERDPAPRPRNAVAGPSHSQQKYIQGHPPPAEPHYGYQEDWCAGPSSTPYGYQPNWPAPPTNPPYGYPPMWQPGPPANPQYGYQAMWPPGPPPPPHQYGMGPPPPPASGAYGGPYPQRKTQKTHAPHDYQYTDSHNAHGPPHAFATGRQPRYPQNYEHDDDDEGSRGPPPRDEHPMVPQDTTHDAERAAKAQRRAERAEKERLLNYARQALHEDEPRESVREAPTPASEEECAQQVKFRLARGGEESCEMIGQWFDYPPSKRDSVDDITEYLDSARGWVPLLTGTVMPMEASKSDYNEWVGKLFPNRPVLKK